MGACPRLGFPGFCADAIPKCSCHAEECGARSSPLCTYTIFPIPGNPCDISPGLPRIFRHCTAVPILGADCLSRQIRRALYLLSRLVHGLFGFACLVRDRAKLRDIFGALLMTNMRTVYRPPSFDTAVCDQRLAPKIRQIGRLVSHDVRLSDKSFPECRVPGGWPHSSPWARVVTIPYSQQRRVSVNGA